ncbi:MAG: phage portal protein [Dehalococcoidia bacterium]|jgi:hypothetical protein
MANIFERIRTWFFEPLFSTAAMERLTEAERYRNYRNGNQRRQLRVRANQHDDNVTLNFTGLVVDRSVTMLFGKGVEFDLPGEGATPEDEYIAAVWAANNKEIWLQKVAILGGEQGTCYAKIVPDGKVYGDKLYPRLVALDPALVTMDTRPDDIEDVLRYRIEYVITGLDGRDEAHKQEIERDDGQVEKDGSVTGGGVWWIRDYVSSHNTSNRWTLVSQERWDYDFAPMIHWQNLPDPVNVYGAPDVTDDVIAIQDRANFVASNISKLIRLYAHPQRYGRNLGIKDTIALGPDEMPNFNGTDSEIRQMDALGDLASSQQFLMTLRQSLFDITQTVDLSSVADKLGALTNFGLRVLYADALSKLESKRRLYGAALLEINRRLLILNGMEGDPGEIVWDDALPTNETEQINAIRADIEIGLLSKQTAAGLRGYDWEAEQERMTGETEAANAGENNIGAMLLRNFTGGQ